MDKKAETYIHSHMGALSAERIARDLNLPERKVQRVIERLKQKQIKRTGTQSAAPDSVGLKPHLPFFACTLILFAILGGLIYSQTFRSSFHFDDYLIIVENALIQSLDHLGALWNEFRTRFLIGLSFALNYKLHGLDVYGYHLFNVAVHILGSFLVCVLYLMFTKTPKLAPSDATRHSKQAAVFAGLIFLAHPIQTMGVTYIWQRSASMAALFYLLAVILYLYSRLQSNRYWYVLSWMVTVLAMFVKEITFTIPMTLCLIEVFFFDNTGAWKKRLIALLPFFATFLIIPLVLVLPGRTFHLNIFQPPSADAMSPGVYHLTQLDVFRTYLRLLLFPVNQNVSYATFPASKNIFDPHTFLSGILVLSVIAAGFASFKKHRILSFAIFWFLLCLSLESFMPLASFMYEHRLYLPMAPFAFFLVSTIQGVRRGSAHILPIGIAITLVLSVLAFERNKVWENEFTLWSDSLKKTPRNAFAHLQLSQAYDRIGQTELERVHAEKALEYSEDPIAPIYDRLAMVYGKKGDFAKSIEYGKKAVTLKPNRSYSHMNLGISYFQQKDYTHALESFQRAVETNPYNAFALSYLGVVYRKMGDAAKDLEFNLKAAAIAPNNPDVLFNLGVAYHRNSRPRMADRQVEELSRLGRHELASQLKDIITK